MKGKTNFDTKTEEVSSYAITTNTLESKIERYLNVARDSMKRLKNFVSAIPKKMIYNAMSFHNTNIDDDISFKSFNPIHLFRYGGYTGYQPYKRYLQRFNTKETNDINMIRIYLGIDKIPFQISEYKPTSLTNSENITFYSISPFYNFNLDIQVKDDKKRTFNNYFGLRKMCIDGLEKLINLKQGEILSYNEVYRLGEPLLNICKVDIGHYTLSFGKDKEGNYMSIYDS